jgi:hypothetical protein
MKPLVVLSSVIANKPYNGGNARMVLNWLEGLDRIGVETFFIEHLRSEHCVDGTGAPAAASDSVNRAYFDEVLGAHGFERRAALVCDADEALGRATVYGATASELYDLASDASLLINISGHLSIDALKRRFRRKVYIDLDPGFTQIWRATGSDGARLDGHDLYYTVGQRIGTTGCRIPTNGITWLPMRQPIVLNGERPPAPSPLARFTTVASWRGAYAPITYLGETWGVKAHEFRKIVDLPRVSGLPFEVALDAHPADVRDVEVLRASGWRLADPRRVAATPADYCSYIEGSVAECSAAQGVYVQTRSGWFSDRTARYLASGRPALVQDTGFFQPERGEGLLAFDTLDEAAAGAERIMRDLAAHSEAARQLAARYFDSNTELGRLMDESAVH